MSIRYSNLVRLFTTKSIIMETKVAKKCVKNCKCNNPPKNALDKIIKEKKDESKYFIPGAEKGLPLPWQKEI